MRGHQRVDQQPQRAVSGQPGDGDPGADDDRDEQAGAGERGQQPPGHRSAHRPGVVTSTRATPVGASQVPTMLAAISVRSCGSRSKIA